MKDDYQINEKDIETVIRYLEIHDPKNADRDYAIQFLESLQATAGELVRSAEGLTSEDIQKALQNKGDESEG